MKNIEEVVFNPKLGIDADLEPILAEDGISLISLRAFGHWRRGFTEEEIGLFFGISSEEAGSCISDVQKRISPEWLDLDTKTRDEILAFKNGSVEEKLGESLSKSVEHHMEERCNPAKALHEYRQTTTPEEPCLISIDPLEPQLRLVPAPEFHRQRQHLNRRRFYEGSGAARPAPLRTPDMREAPEPVRSRIHFPKQPTDSIDRIQVHVTKKPAYIFHKDPYLHRPEQAVLPV